MNKGKGGYKGQKHEVMKKERPKKNVLDEKDKKRSNEHANKVINVWELPFIYIPFGH